MIDVQNTLLLKYTPQLISGETHCLTFISNLTSLLLITFLPIEEKLPRILSLSSNISLPTGTSTVGLNYTGLSPGRAVYKLSPNVSIHLSDQYIDISVIHYSFLQWVSAAIGWMYFFSWSISFYPQIVQNFFLKSTKGLSTNMVLMNFLGYLSYSVFNLSLFWSPYIQGEYFSLHPGGVNPVRINDVIFSVHGFFLTMLIILQIIFYDRKLSISPIGLIFQILLILSVLVTCILSFLSVTTWLTCIYVLSYVKLVITVVKYIPQVWINYKSKSTEGFSIEGVWLDFSGGVLSILQMVILAYNFDDWLSLFGDFVKFWLGAISIGYDLILLFQHYILYRKKKKGVRCFGVYIFSGQVEQESASLLGNNSQNDEVRIN